MTRNSRAGLPAGRQQDSPAAYAIIMMQGCCILLAREMPPARVYGSSQRTRAICGSLQSNLPRKVLSGTSRLFCQVVRQQAKTERRFINRALLACAEYSCSRPLYAQSAEALKAKIDSGAADADTGLSAFNTVFAGTRPTPCRNRVDKQQKWLSPMTQLTLASRPTQRKPPKALLLTNMSSTILHLMKKKIRVPSVWVKVCLVDLCQKLRQREYI